MISTMIFPNPSLLVPHVACEFQMNVCPVWKTKMWQKGSSTNLINVKIPKDLSFSEFYGEK